MAKISAIVVAVATLMTTVCAWGDLGHETIAYIAQDFVSSQTATFVQKILGSTSSSYMASVATWADTYRYTTPGEWSYPLHFIDAKDNPPSTCNVNFARDCTANACVVGALTNFTTQLQSSSTSAADLLMAMKFVIHFVGDIHQPLHDENLDVGGNEIDVTYGKEATNLHHIWDTEMPEQLEGGTTITTARTYATKLTAQIKAGTLGTPSTWISGLGLNQATIMSWATQANAYVCSTVMPNGVDSVKTGDLSTTYYNGVNDVIQVQFARAGYRLAAWLNMIATGSTAMSDFTESASQKPMKGGRRQ